MLFLLISILFLLLVTCVGSWWCDTPHTAVGLLKAHQPCGNSKIFLGGMLGCKVQSLVDAWQLACSTVTLPRLDNTTTRNILFLNTPTLQMQKKDEKARTLLLLFLRKCFLSINHYKSS